MILKPSACRAFEARKPGRRLSTKRVKASDRASSLPHEHGAFSPDGIFRITQRVCDFQLDQFGVVNNSVYCNYLEHCRSEAFHALGFNVHETARQGKALALSQLNMAYKLPLRSRDTFEVRMWVERVTGARIALGQDIFLQATGEQVLTAEAVIVWLDNRYKPVRLPPEERAAFQKLYEQRIQSLART
uniref:Thioesterase domain-containing protein n=1 Tax=Dunaliella tertiolecta TaxID=3047 RepID=A0A7S3QLA9_DUNTE|mmetsp:Transcript_23551/g.64936  ORF Transcript_23551/g.64936 Transcript_23551/m.64936 type:complete len:188 (+) Transcript_23551:60-623(+)